MKGKHEHTIKILASLGCIIPLTVCGYAVHEMILMPGVPWYLRGLVATLSVACGVMWGTLLVSIWKGTE